MVIGETYSTGLEDLNLLKSNYDTNAANIVSQGRAQAKQAVSQGRKEAINAIAEGFSGSSFDFGLDFGSTGTTLANPNIEGTRYIL